MRPPSKEASCPFCCGPAFVVAFTGPLSVEQIRREEKDRSTVEEHEHRIVAESRKNSSARQLTPADFGLSDDSALSFLSSSPTAAAALAASPPAAAAASPLRIGALLRNDDDASSDTSGTSDSHSDAADHEVPQPQDFGLHAVPDRFVGMTIAEIDDALLEEAIAMSLAESVSPHAALSPLAARAAVADAQSSESLESSADGPVVVVAALSQQAGVSAARKAPAVHVVPAAADVGASRRQQPKHTRTASTSSRSDELSTNESDSSWLDPTQLTLSVPSSLSDVLDPEDDLSPSKAKGSTSRRRRKASAVSAANTGASPAVVAAAAAASAVSGASAPSHRRTSSASKLRDADSGNNENDDLQL